MTYSGIRGSYASADSLWFFLRDSNIMDHTPVQRESMKRSTFFSIKVLLYSFLFNPSDHVFFADFTCAVTVHQHLDDEFLYLRKNHAKVLWLV